MIEVVVLVTTVTLVPYKASLAQARAVFVTLERD